ncbi:SUMF1/EgtB/PvdO family nonheme iron enzyme, partial [Candidatus Accumulibacter aalborgensis]|uniref:SUMF1/EgtB/PvdO family nonheme iron enzyme n=1 Tax=Candidatus Accumulibacter aalborgensis TaxID=1860102 RepID=UPI001FE159B9
MERRWIAYPGGLVDIGHDGSGFAFDNEGPRHSVFLQPFELACQPVTNGDCADFIADGGYRRPELWLSLGWDWRQANGLAAPMYWQ